MQYQSAQISISVEAVAREIYAISALRDFLSPDGAAVPQLLSPDHQKALTPVIRSSFLQVALEALGNIESIHPGEDDDSIMPLTIKVPIGTVDTTLRIIRHAIEQAVASATLATCYAGIDPDVADEFAIHLNRSLDTIRILLPPTPILPRISPGL